MGTMSESWLAAMLGSLAPGGQFLARRAAGAFCIVGIAILAGCQAPPQPKSRRVPNASSTMQAVKSSQSNVAPAGDDCGLSAYPASRSTQEILAAVPQQDGRSPGSTMVAKVAIDPQGRVTHLRVLRLAYPEAPNAGSINAQAIDWIKRRRYDPVIVAGKPVAVCSDLAVTIDLY